MPETHSGNPYCGRAFLGFSGQHIREDRYTVAALREAFPDGTAARAWRGAEAVIVGAGPQHGVLGLTPDCVVAPRRHDTEKTLAIDRHRGDTPSVVWCIGRSLTHPPRVLPIPRLVHLMPPQGFARRCDAFSAVSQAISTTEDRDPWRKRK